MKKEVQVYADNRSLNATISEKFNNEKRNLIETIASLKSEIQTMTLSMKKKNDECDKLILESGALNRDVVAANVKIKELELEISQLKTDHSKKVNEYEQNIFNLNHQKQILSARTEQLQLGLMQKDETDNEFEVENIIADKMKGRTRLFLVRWKGYGEADDSWVPEFDLGCPAVLEKYLQNKKK